MNLNKFRPAWDQFRLMNSLHPVTEDEVMRIIETKDRGITLMFRRMVRNTAMYSFLIICCQGC
jgi:hypothetical protein